MKIATWNVNSLRVRLPQVLSWLEQEKPDVLALQEIKMVEADFPFAAINEAGYQVQVAGQKTYNGVAILSKQSAMHKKTDLNGLDDPQRRVLGVTINNIRVINLYIPNGESVTSNKFQYKLNWLNHLKKDLLAELQNHPHVVVLGDFNIAPHEIDVHDPALWQGKVLFSDAERQAFSDILNLGFADCFRTIYPSEQQFTWWDYRMNSFKRNIGLRIDHILASHSLSCKNCYIDKNPRLAERPSDHAPIVAEFKI